MGTIIKESFSQSIVRLSISLVGALSTIFIVPLDRNLYGIISYVLNTSSLFMPFIILGLAQSSVHFFPYHNDSIAERKKFLKKLIYLLLMAVFFFTILFFTSKDWVIQYAKNPSLDYQKYFIYIYPGTLLFGITYLMVRYLSNFKKVTLPIALQMFYRIGIPIAFLLIYFDICSIKTGFYIIFSFLIFAIFSMIILIKKSLHQLPVKENTTEIIKPVNRFSSFYFWAIASSFGAMMAYRIDGFMVPTLTNFTLGGDYNIAVFLITVITIPTTSVIMIANPILSEAWRNNDLNAIKSVYTKGAENLLFIGSVLLMSVLLLIDMLPLILNTWKDLSHISIIVFVLGLGYLYDMASGVNGLIIQHAKWYRYNVIFIVTMIVLNIILNFYLIQSMGILGAAIATSISLIVTNSLEAIFLYFKLGILPLGKSSIFYVLSFLLLCLGYYGIKTSIDSWISILLNMGICLIFFLVSTLFFNYAVDTRIALSKAIVKIKNLI